MSVQQQDSGPTSNDLLESRIAENKRAALNYQIVARSGADIQNIENAPVVCMEPYRQGISRLLTNQHLE
jgi:hypothetical protein